MNEVSQTFLYETYNEMANESLSINYLCMNMYPANKSIYPVFFHINESTINNDLPVTRILDFDVKDDLKKIANEGITTIADCSPSTTFEIEQREDSNTTYCVMHLSKQI